MLDRAIDTIANADSYYFQLYPLSLAVANSGCDLPAQGTTYRFTILKGTPASTQVSKSLMRLNYPFRPTLRRSMAGM